MVRSKSSALRKGKRIDNYEIIEKLGKGWEGEVYKVKDTYSEGPRVLKLFYPKDYRSKQIKLYCKKFEKLSGINGIIKYYHAGYWDEKDTYYLVMEYFKGKNLEERSKKAWSIFRALQVVRRTCEIINNCHTKELCVGDINAANILMNNEGNKIKIIDIDFATGYKQESIYQDITAISKLFYELVPDDCDVPQTLRDVLPKRGDAIQNRYKETNDLLRAIDDLIGPLRE